MAVACDAAASTNGAAFFLLGLPVKALVAAGQVRALRNRHNRSTAQKSLIPRRDIYHAAPLPETSQLSDLLSSRGGGGDGGGDGQLMDQARTRMSKFAAGAQKSGPERRPPVAVVGRLFGICVGGKLSRKVGFSF